MPLVDITNPDLIKFLVESYDKTARLRMKWNNIHGDKLKEAATLQREEKGYFELDVLKASMAAGMPTITRDNLVTATRRRCKLVRGDLKAPGVANLKKGHSIVDVGLGDPTVDPRLVRQNTDLSLDPAMRPVDPKTRKIIYKDIPHFGRQAYLKKRYKIAPEEKFYFQDTSGWEYGWRLKDSYFSRNITQFGRVWSLARNLKGRSGPQPDPDHYNDPDAPSGTKCA